MEYAARLRSANGTRGSNENGAMKRRRPKTTTATTGSHSSGDTSSARQRSSRQSLSSNASSSRRRSQSSRYSSSDEDIPFAPSHSPHHDSIDDEMSFEEPHFPQQQQQNHHHHYQSRIHRNGTSRNHHHNHHHQDRNHRDGTSGHSRTASSSSPRRTQDSTLSKSPYLATTSNRPGSASSSGNSSGGMLKREGSLDLRHAAQQSFSSSRNVVNNKMNRSAPALSSSGTHSYNRFTTSHPSERWETIHDGNNENDRKQQQQQQQRNYQSQSVRERRRTADTRTDRRGSDSDRYLRGKSPDLQDPFSRSDIDPFVIEKELFSVGHGSSGSGDNDDDTFGKYSVDTDPFRNSPPNTRAMKPIRVKSDGKLVRPTATRPTSPPVQAIHVEEPTPSSHRRNHSNNNNNNNSHTNKSSLSRTARSGSSSPQFNQHHHRGGNSSSSRKDIAKAAADAASSSRHRREARRYVGSPGRDIAREAAAAASRQQRRSDRTMRSSPARDVIAREAANAAASKHRRGVHERRPMVISQRSKEIAREAAALAASQHKRQERRYVGSPSREIAQQAAAAAHRYVSPERVSLRGKRSTVPKEIARELVSAANRRRHQHQNHHHHHNLEPPRTRRDVAKAAAAEAAARRRADRRESKSPPQRKIGLKPSTRDAPRAKALTPSRRDQRRSRRSMEMAPPQSRDFDDGFPQIPPRRRRTEPTSPKAVLTDISPPSSYNGPHPKKESPTSDPFFDKPSFVDSFDPLTMDDYPSDKNGANLSGSELTVSGLVTVETNDTNASSSVEGSRPSPAAMLHASDMRAIEEKNSSESEDDSDSDYDKSTTVADTAGYAGMYEEIHDDDSAPGTDKEGGETLFDADAESNDDVSMAELKAAIAQASNPQAEHEEATRDEKETTSPVPHESAPQVPADKSKPPLGTVGRTDSFRKVRNRSPSPTTSGRMSMSTFNRERSASPSVGSQVSSGSNPTGMRHRSPSPAALRRERTKELLLKRRQRSQSPAFNRFPSDSPATLLQLGKSASFRSLTKNGERKSTSLRSLSRSGEERSSSFRSLTKSGEGKSASLRSLTKSEDGTISVFSASSMGPGGVRQRSPSPAAIRRERTRELLKARRQQSRSPAFREGDQSVSTQNTPEQETVPRKPSPMKLMPPTRDTPTKRRPPKRENLLPPTSRDPSPQSQHSGSTVNSPIVTPEAIRRAPPRLPPSSMTPRVLDSEKKDESESDAKDASKRENLRKPDIDEDTVPSAPDIVRRSSSEYLETFEAFETSHLAFDRIKETKSEVETKLQTIIGNLEKLGKREEFRRTRSLTSIMEEQKAQQSNDTSISPVRGGVQRSSSFSKFCSTSNGSRTLSKFLTKQERASTSQKKTAQEVEDDHTFDGSLISNLSKIQVPQPQDDSTVVTTQSFTRSPRRTIIDRIKQQSPPRRMQDPLQEDPGQDSDVSKHALTEESDEDSVRNSEQGCDRPEDDGEDAGNTTFEEHETEADTFAVESIDEQRHGSFLLSTSDGYSNRGFEAKPKIDRSTASLEVDFGAVPRRRASSPKSMMNPSTIDDPMIGSFWVRSVSSAPAVLSGFMQSRGISTSMLLDQLEDETISSSSTSETGKKQHEVDLSSPQSHPPYRGKRRSSLLFQKITEVGKLKEEEMEENKTSKNARKAAYAAKELIFGSGRR